MRSGGVDDLRVEVVVAAKPILIKHTVSCHDSITPALRTQAMNGINMAKVLNRISTYSSSSHTM
jgi:hypothetical protein